MSILLVFVSCLLIACSGGSSDSGGMVDSTLPGSNVPVSFVGTYTGNLTVTASALGIRETENAPIEITVTSDDMVRFPVTMLVRPLPLVLVTMALS